MPEISQSHDDPKAFMLSPTLLRSPFDHESAEEHYESAFEQSYSKTPQNHAHQHKHPVNSSRTISSPSLFHDNADTLDPLDQNLNPFSGSAQLFFEICAANDQLEIQDSVYNVKTLNETSEDLLQNNGSGPKNFEVTGSRKESTYSQYRTLLIQLQQLHPHVRQMNSVQQQHFFAAIKQLQHFHKLRHKSRDAENGRNRSSSALMERFERKHEKCRMGLLQNGGWSADVSMQEITKHRGES